MLNNQLFQKGRIKVHSITDIPEFTKERRDCQLRKRNLSYILPFEIANTCEETKLYYLITSENSIQMDWFIGTFTMQGLIRTVDAFHFAQY